MKRTYHQFKTPFGHALIDVSEVVAFFAASGGQRTEVLFANGRLLLLEENVLDVKKVVCPKRKHE